MDTFELENMRWAPRSTPSKGPRRLCKFCVLAIFIPVVLLCIPLYMRFLALRPHNLILSPSDMKLLNHESRVSTTWCRSQKLSMNSTFHAYLFNERPKITSRKKRIKISKWMDIEDDMKKFWGFYLLKGSSVRLGGCARYPGSSVTLVKGPKDAARCAWLGELDSQEESDEFSNEFDVDFQYIEEAISYTEFLQDQTTGYIQRSYTIHTFEMTMTNTGMAKQDHENWYNSLTAEQKAYILQLNKEKIENKQVLKRSTLSVSKNNMVPQEQKSFEDFLNREDFAENAGGEDDSDDYVAENAGGEDDSDDYVGENVGGEDDSDDYVGENAGGEDDSDDYVGENAGGEDNSDDYVYQQDIFDTDGPMGSTPDHLMNTGHFDQKNTNRRKQDQSREEVRSSDSSSEEALRNCHGFITTYEFNGQKGCTKDQDDASILEWYPFTNTTKTTPGELYINETGFYYFIFSNENEITTNKVHADIELNKTFFSTNHSVEVCNNSTVCELYLDFWSNQHVLVEVPDTEDTNSECDSLGFNNFNNCNFIIRAQSECQPRGEVYMVFLLLVPVIILCFAYI